MRPPRPPHPYPPKPSHVDDITIPNSQSTLTSLDGNSVAHTQSCDLLAEPLTSTSCAQTDQWDQPLAALDVATTSSHVPLEHPRPRPRSKLQPISSSSEVKVQTLVKLREDGAATLAARAGTDAGVSQGKYLQELLEAFSADDWGFPERRSDSSGQSESEEEDEEEDMATLKARIQAFEQQQQQQVADGSCEDFGVTKRPEPRPRPRQPAKSVPPTVAPKPKNFSQAPKPSSKVFWEEPPSTDPQTAPEPTKPAPALVPEPCRNPEKPSVSPKPQSVTEPAPSAPVPAPRPPPPKLTPSISETKPPPRPPVAPRASVGAPPQDKSTAAGHTSPTLPLRPSVEVGSGAQSETGSEETQDAANQTGECYSAADILNFLWWFLGLGNVHFWTSIDAFFCTFLSL